jgi:hypothetical protein
LQLRAIAHATSDPTQNSHQWNPAGTDNKAHLYLCAGISQIRVNPRTPPALQKLNASLYD